MIHHWRPPGKRTEDWKGAVVGSVALAVSIFAIVKAGLPGLVPFGLVVVVVVGFLQYLRWLGRSAS